jgi:hypothetical protein
MENPVFHTALERVKPAHCLTPRRRARAAPRRNGAEAAAA